MSSQVTVRYWAGARRAAGLNSEILAADTVGAVVSQLSERPALSKVLAASSFLVDGITANLDTPLPAGSTLDVLPPFAGG
ncbi:MAG: thiamine S protein [Frankiales bacterium]|nr:thiamine S protein [Frankiales bacterium]